MVALTWVSKSIYGVSLIAVLGLLSGCQSGPRASTLRAPTAAEMALVKQEWIDKECNAGLSEIKFVACVTVSANRMPVFDIKKREQFGNRYDPKQWLECMKRSAETGGRGDGACDAYKLRRVTDPEYWPNPDILPIKWPKSVELPKKPSGMSVENYFKMLCDTQAGEFIYKTVKNVEGLYQIRPIHRTWDQEFQDRYVIEDPYSVTRESNYPWYVFVQPKLGKYEFLEVPAQIYKDSWEVARINKNLDFSRMTSHYIRFFRDENAHPNETSDGEKYILTAEATSQLKSLYGYTWRGIGDSDLRDLGIAGGEQIVVNIQTGEVLAIRRSFLFGSSRGNAIWWMGASHCSKDMTARNFTFINRVLKPIHATK